MAAHRTAPFAPTLIAGVVASLLTGLAPEALDAAVAARLAALAEAARAHARGRAGARGPGAPA